MTGAPGIDSSSEFSSSIRRRSRCISGASRRRMPRFRRARAIDRVLLPQIVALLVGHHLERQLVVVAQEDRPLAVGRNFRRLAQDVGDREAILLRERHVHARHQREMKRHVALIAVAEILLHVLRPLIGLGQQHAAGIARGPLPRGCASGLRASRAGSRCWCLRAPPGTAPHRAGSRPRRWRARSAAPTARAFTTRGLSKFRSGWCE